MTFAFLGASWLWCLPLVAAPVVFHLAWRLRRKRLAVPSLVFFQRLAPRLQARKRLRDWLVLLLRCLAILLVVLALSRPTWSGFLGGSSAAIAIIVDNSASMGLPSAQHGPAQTRLAAALAAAGALVGALDSHDRALVLTTVADPLVPSLTEPTSDRARLRTILDAIRDTHAPSAVGSALTRAGAALEGSSASRREIHVLTDLQVHDWGAPSLGEVHLPTGTTIFLHRIPGSDPATEIALTGIEVTSRGRLSGRPIPLRVTLSNLAAASSSVSLTITDDAGHRRTQAVTVGGHDVLAVPLALPATTAGQHWAQVALDGDDFALDNDGLVAFSCRDRRSVVLCGERAVFGYLPLALAPAADGSLSGLTTRTSDVQGLAAALEAPMALLVMTWDQCAGLAVEDQQRLQHWLTGGGRLALCQGAAGSAMLELPDWLGMRGSVATTTASEPLIALDQRDELLRDLVESDGAIRFPLVRIAHGVALSAESAAPWKPLLGLVDGRALLARRSFGQGEVFCWGLGFSRSWSTLPMSPAFLVVAQAMALPPEGDIGVVHVRAGESTRLPFAHGGQVQVVSIAGDALNTSLALAAGGVLPGFPRAGVYALSNDHGEHLLCAVRCDPDEGRPETISDDRVPALAAGSYRLDTCDRPADLVARYRRSSGGMDLMPWLLVAALLAVLCEGWIANQPLVAAVPPAAARASSGAAA